MANPKRIITILAAVWLLIGPSAAAGSVSLVVTTSILEQAIDELGPSADDLRVVRLIPPGSCPGHFDLSPRSLPDLRSATVIVRHQFQGFLETRLLEMGVEDATVVVADAGGSLLIPEHYGRLVRRVGDIISDLAPGRESDIDSAVAGVQSRMHELESAIAARRGPWRGAKVLASFQQAQFCRWLGLDVVAEIGRPEDTSPRDFEGLLERRPAMVIANLQEGLEAASVIADRLNVPLVVFSNFPGADGYGLDYDGLVTSNLDRLDTGWRTR
jgi:zinc transport system substrate-binding protein